MPPGRRFRKQTLSASLAKALVGGMSLLAAIETDIFIRMKLPAADTFLEDASFKIKDYDPSSATHSSGMDDAEADELNLKI